MRGAIKGLGGVFTVLFILPIGIAWFLAEKKRKDGWSGFLKILLAIFLTIYTVADYNARGKKHIVDDIEYYGIVDILKGEPSARRMIIDYRYSADEINSETKKIVVKAEINRWLKLAVTMFYSLIILFLVYSSSNRSRALKKANADILNN